MAKEAFVLMRLCVYIHELTQRRNFFNARQWQKWEGRPKNRFGDCFLHTFVFSCIVDETLFGLFQQSVLSRHELVQHRLRLRCMGQQAQQELFANNRLRTDHRPVSGGYSWFRTGRSGYRLLTLNWHRLCWKFSRRYLLSFSDKTEQSTASLGSWLWLKRCVGTWSLAQMAFGSSCLKYFAHFLSVVVPTVWTIEPNSNGSNAITHIRSNVTT